MPGLIGKITGWLAGLFEWFDVAEEEAEGIFLIDLIQDIQVSQIDAAVISGGLQALPEEESPGLLRYVEQQVGFQKWEPWAVFRD